MYRTAYVELNGTHEILSLSKTADEKVFTYKNVDFFPHAVMSTLTEILNMRYERVIIDFGILNPNTLKEFMRCDIRIAVCTISKWNRGALNRIIELFNSNKITDSESVKILFNLVEKKKTISINHSYIFGQVLKSSQMPVKPYFMGVPGSFHIRHSSRIFSHLGIS